MLVTKMRWRTERDYQELKHDFGLSHCDGQAGTGFITTLPRASPPLYSWWPSGSNLHAPTRTRPAKAPREEITQCLPLAWISSLNTAFANQDTRLCKPDLVECVGALADPVFWRHDEPGGNRVSQKNASPSYPMGSLRPAHSPAPTARY